MSRKELYQLVWSTPMRTLAAAQGISDVALAKQCRRANVPVPPRGWWARKAAGRKVSVIPLPPLPFALRNYFPAIAHRSPPDNASQGETAAEPEAKPSPPPTFRDLGAVRDEISAALGRIKVAENFDDPHPIIARLLKQDAERKSGPGALSDYYGPKFNKPMQQRRLRVLSAIFKAFERLGCKCSGATHAGERFSISIGGSWIHILFSVENNSYNSPFFRERRRTKEPDRDRLRFDVVDHSYESRPERTWRDDEKPIERQVNDIVLGILFYVEDSSRASSLRHHQWMIEQRAREIEQARLAAEKAERDRIAREKAAEAARIKRLIDGADALETAERIRRYVDTVRTRSEGFTTPIAQSDLESWAGWALAQANRIDPVKSGDFLADITSPNAPPGSG